MGQNKIQVCDQVTNAEYRRFRPGHVFPSHHENKPVVNVTYNDAMAYAQWLSRSTGEQYRLITESERLEAESTFVADFSKHPLPEMPDVGAFGHNAEGVTGLLGVTYDWCLDPEDMHKVLAGWAALPAPAPAPQPAAAPAPAPQPAAGFAGPSLMSTLLRLRAEQAKLTEEIAAIEAAQAIWAKYNG